MPAKETNKANEAANPVDELLSEYLADRKKPLLDAFVNWEGDKQPILKSALRLLDSDSIEIKSRAAKFLVRAAKSDPQTCAFAIPQLTSLLTMTDISPHDKVIAWNAALALSYLSAVSTPDQTRKFLPKIFDMFQDESIKSAANAIKKPRTHCKTPPAHRKKNHRTNDRRRPPRQPILPQTQKTANSGRQDHLRIQKVWTRNPLRIAHGKIRRTATSIPQSHNHEPCPRILEKKLPRKPYAVPLGPRHFRHSRRFRSFFSLSSCAQTTTKTKQKEESAYPPLSAPRSRGLGHSFGKLG